MMRQGYNLVLCLTVLLCSFEGGKSKGSEERPRDMTALLLQRSGPEIIIVEYNVTTGRPTGLRKVIKRQWPSLQGLAVDSQQQRIHFFTEAPRMALHSFALGESNISELMSTDGLRLRDASNSSVAIVWNVAPLESSGNLVAVAPSTTDGFNTSVLTINTTSGLVSVLGQVRGTLVQGIFAIDSGGGRYFFILNQGRRVLVVYHFEDRTYERVRLGRDGADLVGMHYDRIGSRLMLVFARSRGVLDIFTVGLPKDQGDEATLTHLSTIASSSTHTYEPYQYMGLTALLRVGGMLSMLQLEPNRTQCEIHDLERKSYITVDISNYEIVGMAIRTRRNPTVTGLHPAYIGTWGQSRRTIFGFDFGLRDPSPVVFVGNTMASSVAWISDSAVSFKTAPLSSCIVDPWFRADGFLYRTSWGRLEGPVESQHRKEVKVCHPSYEAGRVCAYAGTAQECRCRELSVGFVCARWDSGRDEIGLDVQLGLEGHWLASNITADVVPTWSSVNPTRARVDGGQILSIVGGPFTENNGDLSCSFGGQIHVPAIHLNHSMVTCNAPRWPHPPGMTHIKLIQGGSVMPSDSDASFLFTPYLELVLLSGPSEVLAQADSLPFEIELRASDGNISLQRIYNVSVQIVHLALTPGSAGVISNGIQEAIRRVTVGERVSFVLSIEGPGTYEIRFSTEHCGEENGVSGGGGSGETGVGSVGCCPVSRSTNLTVLHVHPIKTISVSAPRHALAGIAVYPSPQIRVLDSLNRESKYVSVQVVATLDGTYDSTAFAASNVTTSGGFVNFTDLTILPHGTHTIIFRLTGAYSHIQVKHNISILVGEPRRLFNDGSRPLSTHFTMTAMRPPPSLWVLDVAGNKIITRYWTQESDGTLVPHYLNILIRAELSRAASDGIVPAGKLHGAVNVSLKGQNASAGQCLTAASNGTCSPANCNCQLGWQGAECSLPCQSYLCGGGDVCGSNLGYWDDAARKCICLNSSSLQYSVTQTGGQAAEFNDLFIDTQGKGYMITFTSEGLSTASSLLFSVAPGNGSRLYVTSHPPWGAAGVGLSSAPIVVLKDSGKNVVGFAGPYGRVAINVTVNLVDAQVAATLTGTRVRKIYDGRAIFSDLIVNLPSVQNGRPYRLEFIGLGVQPAYTNSFEVEEGPPHSLKILQQPGAASGGTPFSLQPKLAMLDAAGNIVGKAQGRVVAALLGSEILLGNTEVPVQDGLAEFTDLIINRNATDYQIQFLANLESVNMPPGIRGHKWYVAVNLSALSHTFGVMEGRVVRMLILRQPGQAYGGEILPQPVVHFVDKGGNTVPMDRMVVSVAVRQEQGADVILGSYASDTGSIEFTDLKVLIPGTRFQLVFTINETASQRWTGREPSVVSSFFSNTYGSLSNLSIMVQPDHIAAGWYFSSAIKIMVTDKSGNLVPKNGIQIRVGIDSSTAIIAHHNFKSSLILDGSLNPACSSNELLAVEGTSPVSTIQGVAVFTDLRVGRAGSGFRLVFESDLLDGVVSQRFGVTLGELAVSLHAVCSPGVEVAGMAFAQQPILDVVDKGGNRIHAQMPQIIVAKLISHSAAGLQGALSASIYGDLASFTNLAIEIADTGYVIEFYAEGLKTARTYPFEVIPGAAVALHIQAPMRQPIPGEPFALNITSRDRGGNFNSSKFSQPFNVTAKLLRVKSLTRFATCRGSHDCLARLNLSVPAGSHLLRATMSIKVSCSDFDSIYEQVTSILIGSYSLRQTSEYVPGPFTGCFRDCSKSAQITKQYDIMHEVCLGGGNSNESVCQSVPLLEELNFERWTRWDQIQNIKRLDTSSVPLKIQVSKDVNFHPCNSYLLDATVEVVITYGEPEDESVLLGNRNAISHDGLAVFTNLQINVIQRDYVLHFASNVDNLLQAFSDPFQLSCGPIRKLVILSQPVNGTGNTTLNPAPVVMLADSVDNRVNASGVLVFAQLIVRNGIRPLAAQLMGSTSVESRQGLVQFTDLFVGIKSEYFKYTVVFSLTGDNLEPACNASRNASICSAPFTVFEGPACCMRLLVMPKTSFGGVPFSSQPVLKAYDWGGNEVALNNSRVAVQIGVNGGLTGKLLGNPALFSNGFANFTDLAIDKAGANYTVVFMSANMISITSLPFNILVGEAIRLVAQRQVAGARVNKLFRTQPSVAALDAGRNIVVGWNGTVLVVLDQQGSTIHASISNKTNANLTGTTTGFTYKGISYFWNLRLDRMGIGFQLRFSASGLIDDVSAPFDVFGEDASKLVILSSPTVYVNMLPNPEIVVAAVDDAGQVDGFSTRRFQLNLLQPIVGSIELIEPPTVMFSKGILTITGLRLLGMGLQGFPASWNITEITDSPLSVVSEPFEIIDPITGWWTLVDRTSTKSLFLKHNASTFQVLANIEMLNTVTTTPEPSFSSKYGSVLNGNDGCVEMSVLNHVKNSSAILMGYHLRSCKSGELFGTGASKVMSSNIDATWARDILHLEIRDYVPENRIQKFIVIANSKNSSSSTSETVVYRWNGRGFEAFQRLDTKGAHDIEHFVFAGVNYIIVANHFDENDNGYGVPSVIYKYAWSDSEERYIFKSIQTISTEGSVAWKFFEIEGQQFLVTANYFNGSHYEIGSSVFEVLQDSFVPRLSLVQVIPTNGARDVVYISDENSHLIAFANRYEESVLVMKWSHWSQRFQPLTHLPCSQALDLEVFTVNGVSYVVCISLTNIELASGNIPVNGSAVFKYDGNDFVRVQQLPTQSGRYMSLFSSGKEILLSIANVELIIGDDVPVHLRDRNPGTTDIFAWDGTQFVPYLVLPTAQGYANAILDVPCSGVSIDGFPCASRLVDRLILVAQGEASGIQTIVLDSVNATRVATHLKMLAITPVSTNVSSRLPAISGQVMNVEQPLLSSIQRAVMLDSLQWSSPCTGMLRVPNSAPAHGVTKDIVNPSGFVVFSDAIVVSAGPVSMRLSNEYLNDVRMAWSNIFHVAPGTPTQLIVRSAGPLTLLSGETLTACVTVSDAFGNHQPVLPSPVTITAFSNGTSDVTLANGSVTTSNGVAYFMMPVVVSFSSRNAVIGFRAQPFASAFTPRFNVTIISTVKSVESSDILIASVAVKISNSLLFFFGGRKGQAASTNFRLADISETPFRFWKPNTTGTLPEARFNHAVVGNVVQNAQEVVLVIGGTNGTATFDEVHQYNVVTGEWRSILKSDSVSRFGHRAALALLTSRVGSGENISCVVAVGGQGLSGSSVRKIAILRVHFSIITVETVAVEYGSPFAQGILDCCSFMFNWHEQNGYVFGMDSSQTGALYRLEINYTAIQNSFVSHWYRLTSEIGSASVSPRSALSSSAVMLGKTVYFIATQSTQDEYPSIYGLDLSAATPKWSEVGLILNAPRDSLFSLVEVALGQMMLTQTGTAIQLRYRHNEFESQTRKILSFHNAVAMVLSIVMAEKLMLLPGVSSKALSGVPFSVPPTVQITSLDGKLVRDLSGYAEVKVTAVNLDTMAPVRLQGQQVVMANDGVATFPDLAVVQDFKRIRLKFSSPSLVATTWGPIEVQSGPGAVCVFVVQPYGAQRGQPFSIQPTAKLTDAAGNDVPSDSSTSVSVGLEMQVGSQSNVYAPGVLQWLTGTTVNKVINGTVAFTDLGMAEDTPVKSEFRLTISAEGMAKDVSSSFHITLPSETRLHFNWTTETDICSQPSTVSEPACNAYRNRTRSRLVLTAGRPPIRDPHLIITLSSTLTRYYTSASFQVTVVWSNRTACASCMQAVYSAAVEGEVYFKGLQLPITGEGYRFKVESKGFPVLFSEAFDVLPGVPLLMHLMRNPLQINPAALAFPVQPIVYVTDANGNAVDVAMIVFAKLGGGSIGLLGNVAAITKEGKAIFTNLAVQRVGAGYTLNFSASDMCCGNQLNVTSAKFDVNNSNSYKLSEDNPPGGGKGNEPFQQQPSVHVLDAGGNLVTNESSTVVTASLEKDGSLETTPWLLGKISSFGKTVSSMEHFRVDGTDYVMLTIEYDSAKDSYHVESVLYRWDRLDEMLEEVQRIPTDGASFCKHVRYENKHYLFVANGYKEIEVVDHAMVGTYLTDSDLYEFRNGYLEKVFAFGTYGPSSIAAFDAGNLTFIVVANSFNGTHTEVDSNVYLLTPNEMILVTLDASSNTSICTENGCNSTCVENCAMEEYGLDYQRYSGCIRGCKATFDTTVASSWQDLKFLTWVQDIRLVDVSSLGTFYSSGDIYLVAGMRFNTTSFEYKCNSKIFKFHKSSLTLEPWQTIPTYGIVAVEFLIIGDYSFIALGNSYNKEGTNNDGFVAIHEFKDGLLQETASQEIGPIKAMTDMRHFHLNGTEFLAVTSNPTDGAGSLLVYTWEASNYSNARVYSPNFTLSEQKEIQHAESVVYFRDEGDDSAYLVYGGTSGLQGIAFRSTGRLIGTKTATAYSGVATFTDLALNLVQTNYRLRYKASGLLSFLGNYFNVTSGSPVGLSLVVEADNALGGDSFATQPHVGLVDKGGNLVTTESGRVITVFLENGSTQQPQRHPARTRTHTHTLAAQLTGNFHALVQDGVATYTDLGIDLIGSCVLVFTAANCPSASSSYNNGTSTNCSLISVTQEVTVKSGVAHGLVVFQAAGLSLGGLSFGQQPMVSIVDAGGNNVISDEAHGGVALRVAVRISSVGNSLSGFSLSNSVKASMLSLPGGEVVLATVHEKALMVMSTSNDSCIVLTWDSEGPSIIQTLAVGHVLDLAMIRAQKKLLLFVVSAMNSQSILWIMVKLEIKDGFALQNSIIVPGLSFVKGMLLGGKAFVFASGELFATKFTLAQINTSKTIKGVDKSFNLDRQNLDCGDFMMNGFQLAHEYLSDGDSLNANLTCSGDCPCDNSFNTTSGTFSDGPGNYDNNVKCVWLITSDAVISLSFTFFDLERNWDSVILNRCTSGSCGEFEEVARLSGSADIANATFKSSTGYLQVVFTSDASITRPGFIASWSLERRAKLMHAIKCAQLPPLSQWADITSTKVKSTNYDNTGNGNLIFLDRHNVDCGSDAAISQFKLVRDQALIKYEYTCKIGPPGSMFDCEDLATPLDDGGQGSHFVDLLDRHAVFCPENKVLQKFKLNNQQGDQSGKINYIYRCCYLFEPKRNHSVVDYLNSSICTGTGCNSTCVTRCAIEDTGLDDLRYFECMHRCNTASSSYSRIYSLGGDHNVTLKIVQNMSIGRVVDAEHFRHNYKDYLLVQSKSHLILNIWNSNEGNFDVLESVEFLSEDVEVTCCSASGLPLIALASLTNRSVFTVLEGAQSGQIGLQNIIDILKETRQNLLPSFVSGDTVRHIWSGRTLCLCYTNRNSVLVYKGEHSWLGEMQMQEMSLPPSYKPGATTLNPSITFFEASGAIYLLITGRDEEVIMLLLDGPPGTLSGTTVVLAKQGLAQFTDLALDLAGSYELSFLAPSLDNQHESHDAQVAAGVTMNLSVAVGEASSVMVTLCPEKCSYASLSFLDHGGNLLDVTSADHPHVNVMLTQDQLGEFSKFAHVSSHAMEYPAHVHHFIANGIHFVAVANSYNGSTYVIDSLIMKLYNRTLQRVHKIQTKCAYRFSSFNITTSNIMSTPNGDSAVVTSTDFYLTVANHFDDTSDFRGSNEGTFVTNSVVYRMDNPDLVVVQEIRTFGATKLEPFVINSEQYLGIANFFDGSFYSVNSQIWLWNATAGKFSWLQDIETSGAHDIEHISTGGKHFLLIAQYRGSEKMDTLTRTYMPTDFASASLVLQYNEILGKFEMLTEFVSSAARDIEVFNIMGVSFFAVANYASPNEGTMTTKSSIYRLGCFEEDILSQAIVPCRYGLRVHQSFDTTGASTWNYFERSGFHYLAITSLVHGDIAVFVWNGTGFKFSSNYSTNGNCSCPCPDNGNSGNVGGSVDGGSVGGSGDCSCHCPVNGGKVMSVNFFPADGLFFAVVALPESSAVNLYRFESVDGQLPKVLMVNTLGSWKTGDLSVLFPPTEPVFHSYLRGNWPTIYLPYLPLSCDLGLSDSSSAGSSSAFLNPLADILNLYPAYLMASAESWNVSRQRFTDLSGNGRVGTLQAGTVSFGSVTGNGAGMSVPYVGGTTETQISWGAASIPSNFTICSITRYSGAVKQRILQCGDANWLHGHWRGYNDATTHAGATFYQGAGELFTTNIPSDTDWVVACGRNIETTGSVGTIIDGVPTSVAEGGKGNCALGINWYTQEASDWQLSKVYVWDIHLPDDVFANASSRLINYLAGDYLAGNSTCSSGGTTTARTFKDAAYEFWRVTAEEGAGPGRQSALIDPLMSYGAHKPQYLHVPHANDYCPVPLCWRPFCEDETSTCGDSRLSHGEMCDDGNKLGGDGCSPDCIVEAEWLCSSPACGQSVCRFVACPTNANAPVGGSALTDCTCNAGYAGPNGGFCEACPAGKYKVAPARSVSPTASVTCSGGCPCNPSTDTSSGTVTDGTSDYENVINCRWLIASDGLISLSFSSFETGSGYVTINRCTSFLCGTVEQVARLSGSSVSASTAYTSTTGYLQVVFNANANSNETNSGFVASWNISAGSALCIDCFAGTYSDVVGASLSTCIACGGGTYSTAVGASSASTCLSCGAGTYSTAVGASSASTCLACGAGTYSTARGTPLVSACVACGAGTYSTAPGASSASTCVACGAGTYCSAIGGGRALALLPSKVAFTSASTRDSAPVGSIILPVYNSQIRMLLNNVTGLPWQDMSGSGYSATYVAGGVAVVGNSDPSTDVTVVFTGPLTVMADPLGSAILPVYNASGGPQGRGHVTFDRTWLQFLDAGPRTLNISSNGGLTIVTVVRFTGNAGSNERIIDLGSGAGNNSIVLARYATSASLSFLIHNGQNKSDEHIFPDAIVQDMWLTVVVRYRASTGEYVVTVNNATGYAGNFSASVTDRRVSRTWIGKGQNNEAYFNGDMAGVFVLDEYLSAETTSAIVEAMVWGQDFTAGSTLRIDCFAGTYSTAAGASSVSTCLACGAGTYSTTTGAKFVSACLACGAGTYSRAVGASSASTCIACEAGKYCTFVGISCTAAIPEPLPLARVKRVSPAEKADKWQWWQPYGCTGGTETTTEGKSSGIISDGPREYGSNADCEWRIVTEPNIKITLTLDFLDLESCCDHLYIESCAQENCEEVVELANLPSSSPKTSYTSTTGFLRVRMTSDSFVEYEGFTASWTVSSQQSSTIYQGEGTLCNPGATTLARAFSLLPNKVAFASVSTRDSAPVGSAILPVYTASGGPQGRGHVTFDRTRLQFLDAGPRTLNISSNGGLTIVTVVRFTGNAGSNERIIDLGSGAGNNSIVLARYATSASLSFLIHNGQNKSDEHIFPDAIVQDMWLTVVVRYRASTGEYVVTVNNATGYAGNFSASVTDRRVSRTWIGKGQNNEAYFNGDMAGVFVLDEYLSAETTSAIVEAMVWGQDFTAASTLRIDCFAGTYSTAAGASSVSTCVACGAGTYSTGGASTCLACGAGTYSTEFGASSASTCLACPSNSSSPAGSSVVTNCTCNVGYSGSDGHTCI